MQRAESSGPIQGDGQLLAATHSRYVPADSETPTLGRTYCGLMSEELHEGRGVHVLDVHSGVAAVLLALACIVSGCGGSDGPSLTYPSANVVTEGADRVHQGDTVTIGSMFGCLNKPGRVTVLSVTPVKPVGLKVRGFGVRPNPFWKHTPGAGGQIMVARSTLAALNFSADRSVTVECNRGGQEGAGYEFAVEVEKTASGEAGASGWIVTYKTGDDTRKLGYPIRVRLCNENSSDAAKCQALKV